MKRLLIVLTVLGSQVFAFQIQFPQDTIAYNDKFNNRQSIAFDSQGKLHVVYSGQIGTTSTTREIYYVTDSADGFSTRLLTTNAVDDNYPTIDVDKRNNAHVGFLGRDAGNLFQVQYTRQVNGVFTTPLYITSGGLNKATPQCAIGRDSVVHFVYHTFPPTGTQYAYYRKYDLRDSTLSAEQQLAAASVTGEFDAGIAVDSSGYVHIVVKSGSTSGGPLKYYTNRTGTLIETPTGVVVDVDYPRILVDKRNVVHILYRNSPTEVLYVINNSSGTFGAPVALTPPGQRPSGYHNFAVDDEQRLYVVYQSSVATSGRGWYLVHGKDGSFSDTLQIFDLPPEYVTRNTSAIAARGNGAIAVTYSPGAVRAGSVVCDIFLRRGTLQITQVQPLSVSPVAYRLLQNYPNPFNPTTKIRFQVSSFGFVSLMVYDVLGRELRSLVNEELKPGSYEMTFDAETLPSGVYIYRLQTGNVSVAKKMVIAK